MKQKLLFLIPLFFIQLTLGQDIFPDTWEFRGMHASTTGTAFTAPGPNPAGLDTAVLPTPNGRLSAPVLVDLDGDNDLDMVSGSQSAAGKLYYYENTGSSTAPNWVQTALPTLDAVAFTPGGNNETKCRFVDIDDDGDFDLFFGAKLDPSNFNFNDIHYYENTGTATVPNFVLTAMPGTANQNVANFPSFAFVDIDDDMDLDMVTMGSDSLAYFQNIGTKTMPSFERKFHLENPWDLDAGTGLFDRNWPHPDNLTTIPNFHDIDRDGDYDMIFGVDNGTVRWIENIGTASAPDFGTYTYQVPTGDLGSFDFGQFATISFGDVTGDGVLDAIMGAFNPGYFAWFEGVNTSTLSVSEITLTSDAVVVSPNPAKDVLNIQFTESRNFEKLEISIYAYTGQIVHSETIDSVLQSELQINISDLSTGMYIMKLKNEHNHSTIKQIQVK